jgi:hypothetical protein
MGCRKSKAERLQIDIRSTPSRQTLLSPSDRDPRSVLPDSDDKSAELIDSTSCGRDAKQVVRSVGRKAPAIAHVDRRLLSLGRP